MNKSLSKSFLTAISSVALSLSASAFSLGSADVGGLLQFDAATFSGDKQNVSRSSADVRRADLWIKGNLPEEWSYQLGYDARYNLLNASWVGYGGIDYFWLAMGYVDVPQSLDYWSSYTYGTFMEDASPVTAMKPHKGLGLYADAMAFHNLLSYQVAFYTPDIYEETMVQIRTRSDVIGSATDPWGIAGRAVFRPDVNLGDVFHVGGSGRYEGVSETNMINALVTTPGVLGRDNSTSNADNIFVTSMQPDEGALSAITAWGVELAELWGPLTAQGEYLGTFWQGRGDNDSLNFWGWYAQVAYVLTGESRHYDTYSGTIGNVHGINHQYGAWELALRYAYTDLNDKADVGYSEMNDTDFLKKRGTQNDWTLGLNWYVIENVKLQANFVYATADYAEESQGNPNIKALALRGQVDF
jgi:phosphate-selective porin OprO/OprP